MKFSAKQNMGITDRTLRIFTGIILVVFGILMLKEIVGIILLVFSIPLLISGITGFCPGYIPFGISTKRESSHCLK